MNLNTRLIANLFLNCIIPQYKISFKDNWIDALEVSCLSIKSDIHFDGIGLTKEQTTQIINMGPRVSICFESLLKNTLVVKYEKSSCNQNKMC
jgi:hypothetical protein